MKEARRKEAGAGPHRLAIKFYGERNTGTNYLAELFRRNVEADILSGQVPRSDVRAMMTRRLRGLMPAVTERLHERARDRYFEATFDSNLGWKHMCPAPDRMTARTLQDVRFIMVVKNPYAWLLSLFAKPYHVGGQDARFDDFLNRHLPVMEVRENIGAVSLRPAEVWNRKIRGYLDLAAVAAHAKIVRYEDFLKNEQEMIRQVAAELDIPVRDTLEGVGYGVKSADQATPQTDYARYYLEERWRAKLSGAEIGHINALLDPALVVQMGYQPLDPSTQA